LARGVSKYNAAAMGALGLGSDALSSSFLLFTHPALFFFKLGFFFNKKTEFSKKVGFGKQKNRFWEGQM
jgi:hypothetical protein